VSTFAGKKVAENVDGSAIRIIKTASRKQKLHAQKKVIKTATK